jgi:saccharopine dehydrogenase-like NADP-dependent oxidoreductase
MDKQRKKIIVLGGYGAIGSRICTSIARIPYVECVIAGRNPKRARRLAKSVTASMLRIDAEDETAVSQNLAGAFMVIDAAGPFQRRSMVVAQYCASHGIHYIDVADDRQFVNDVLQLNATAKRNECLLVTGSASLPALAAVLVESLAGYYDKIDEIHSAAVAGNSTPVGPAGARSLLHKIGVPTRLKIRGRWQEAPCWTQPGKNLFPEPFLNKRTYLYSVPAVDHFARQFGVRDATFRFGLQLGVFNRGLVLLAWLRRIGWLKQPERYARMFLAFTRWFRRFGGSGYSVQVQVLGAKADNPVEHSATLFEADSDKLGLLTSITVTLVKRWIEHGVPDAGAVSAIGVVDLDALKPELIAHDVKLIRA